MTFTWQKVLALIAGTLAILVLVGFGDVAVFLTVAVLLLAIILVA